MGLINKKKKKKLSIRTDVKRKHGRKQIYEYIVILDRIFDLLINTMYTKRIYGC